MNISTVTRYFAIDPSGIEFVDVNVFDDNRLFVDPSAIRWHAAQGDPWSTDAYEELAGFFDALLEALPGGGLQMLVDFHEPNETRLGMSRAGTVRGRGAAAELGHRIWDSMRTNPLCLLTVPVFRRLEHLPLFVNDIDRDLVSDIATRIIFKELVDFTHRQMRLHPELGPGEDCTIEWVWNQHTKTWAPHSFTLPYVVQPDGSRKPLLLVPQRAVYSSLRMSARKYWSKAVLDEVQDNEAVVVNGKLVKTPKDVLKSREDLRSVRPSSQTWTERVLREQDRDLVAVYEQWVQKKFAPLSAQSIQARVLKL